MKTRGATTRRVRDSQWAGRLTLLVLMAVLSVGVVAGSGATIAFAASPAASGASGVGVPVPPMVLPGDAAASGTGADSSCDRCATWIVGGKPGPATAAIAKRLGARPVAGGTGAYRVPRGKARKVARALSRTGRLAFAEPDIRITPAAYPGDLFDHAQTWLGQIVNTSDQTPPRVHENSPLIGLIEKGVDRRHPDLEQAKRLVGATSTGEFGKDSHGTAIAGIIGSPGEGLGIRGVWPDARIEHFPSGETCSTASKAVIAAARAGASVLNMSYTFSGASCYTHYLATGFAVNRDVLPVAAAGNSAHRGNTVEWPAADPHVLSVGAVNANNRVAFFSTRNRFVDITAPGQRVFAPVVVGRVGIDGVKVPFYEWTTVNGTSFAAPMVAAAAAWLRQIRPGWSGSQTARALADSAQDLGPPGRDPLYGEGLLDIDAALLAPRPVDDPMEPNDDIPLLKGEGGLPKAKYLWKPRGEKVVKLRATLSRDKDPADVYRVRIPARKQVLITVAQLQGSVRVMALKPSAKNLGRKKGKVIVRSDKPFPKTEGIKVKNLRRKPQDIWLALTPSRGDRTPLQIYRLKIRRSR